MAPHLAVRAFFAVLLLALAAPAAGASQTSAGLSVSGQASQEFTPDQGRLVLGAITQAPTSAEAARQNAAVMERINAAVKAKFTEHDRLRSVGYQLYPRTEWDNVARRSRRVGYEANHRLEVISRDIQALGAILDAAVAAGANTVSGPTWSLANPAAARRQVQAQALAQAAGLQLGAITSLVVEGGEPHFQTLAAAPPPPETSLEPRMITVRASLRVIYAIAPRP